MSFIVTSQGRPIGTTDLGFLHFGGTSRSGWFVPNELGEKLVPRIATPLPAMRAYFLRDCRDNEGNGVVDPTFLTSPLLADLAEHVQHMAALELALQREDGSLVPTTSIGIQDMEVLGEMGRRAFERMEAEEEREGWQRDDATLDELEEADASDPGPFALIIDADTGEAMPWEPDEDYVIPENERYQIHVHLADARDVPGEALPPYG